VPSSTTIIIGLSSIGRSNITKLVPKSNQQLATLQQQQEFGLHEIKNLLLRFLSNQMMMSLFT